MSEYYLTKERFEELKKELDELKSKSRMEVAEALRRSKEFGDLSENSEYAEAREKQSQVEGRIFELEELLRRAEIIKKEGVSILVEIGSKVTAVRDGKIAEYTIVGSDESRPEENKISNESPLGRALLGHGAGDKVEIQTPSGKAVYEITRIE